MDKGQQPLADLGVQHVTQVWARPPWGDPSPGLLHYQPQQEGDRGEGPGYRHIPPGPSVDGYGPGSSCRGLLRWMDHSGHRLPDFWTLPSPGPAPGTFHQIRAPACARGALCEGPSCTWCRDRRTWDPRRPLGLSRTASSWWSRGQEAASGGQVGMSGRLVPGGEEALDSVCPKRKERRRGG